MFIYVYILRSLVDETVRDVDIQVTELTLSFQVVDYGSTRGKRKLVSNDGYAYTYKRTQANGTIEWRCCVRGRNTCPAMVKQKGTDFKLTKATHIHPSKPGLLTAVQVTAEVRPTIIKLYF